MDPRMGGAGRRLNHHRVAVVLSAIGLLLCGAGMAHSQVAPTLPESLDQEGWAFTAGGDASWLGQGDFTSDGVDAAQSGGIDDNQVSWVETSQQVVEDGFIVFRWKASSEQGYDFLRFSIDGVPMDGISGEVDWRSAGFAVTAGDHVFRWEYSKDGSFAEGMDAGWVDQVAFTTIPPPVEVDLSVSTYLVTGLSVGVSPADRNSLAHGVTPFERSYAYDETVTLTAPPTSPGGDLQGWLGCDSFDGVGCTVQMAGNRSVTAVYGPSLSEALDQPTWAFAVGGEARWIGVPTEYPGIDFAFAEVRSGQTATLETVQAFGEPGHFSFLWWGVVEFYLDDMSTPAATLADYSIWQPRSFPVSAGPHTLRWVTRAGAGGDVASGLEETAFMANAAPVASDAVLRSLQNSPTMLTLDAMDPDGDALTYRIVRPPAHGSVSGTAPGLIYQPAVDYTGPDSFTFSANDGLTDGNTATVSITVLNAVGAIFFDDFADGAAPVDWLAHSGMWSARGKVYTASSLKKNNVARVARFDPPNVPLGVGTIQSRIKLTPVAARTGPNGMIVFGHQDPAHYRWVKVTKSQILIGQTGTIGGIAGGTKKKVAKAQALNRFGLYTVKIHPDGWVRVYKGTAGKPVLAHRFLDGGAPSVVPGSVGLAASKAKTVFDDVTVWDDPGL